MRVMYFCQHTAPAKMLQGPVSMVKPMSMRKQVMLGKLGDWVEWTPGSWKMTGFESDCERRMILLYSLRWAPRGQHSQYQSRRLRAVQASR